MFFGPHLVQTVKHRARALPPSGTQIESGHKILRKQNIENKSVLNNENGGGNLLISLPGTRIYFFGDVLFGFLDLVFGDMILGCCTKHVVFNINYIHRN